MPTLRWLLSVWAHTAKHTLLVRRRHTSSCGRLPTHACPYYCSWIHSSLIGWLREGDRMGGEGGDLSYHVHVEYNSISAPTLWQSEGWVTDCISMPAAKSVHCQYLCPYISCEIICQRLPLTTGFGTEINLIWILSDRLLRSLHWSEKSGI